jgi:hypothetical protein
LFWLFWSRKAGRHILRAAIACGGHILRAARACGCHKLGRCGKIPAARAAESCLGRSHMSQFERKEGFKGNRQTAFRGARARLKMRSCLKLKKMHVF